MWKCNGDGFGRCAILIEVYGVECLKELSMGD